MNKPLLSICISVHNTEKYLVRCLDSITTQSYNDYEIILVNNGSTDNSFSIMEKYRDEHPDVQISVFSQEDRGLAQGRQTGINNVRGEYITFIDADDYYIGNALEILMSTIQREQVDIVEMQSKKDDKIIKSAFNGLHSTKDILRHFFEYPCIAPMLWLRVYRAKLFNKDSMPKIYTNNEDMFVLPCILHFADTIFFLEETLHVYFTGNAGGVMNSYNERKSNSEVLLNKKKNTLHICEFIRSKIGQNAIEKNYKTFDLYQKRILLAFIFGQPLQVCFSQKMEIIQKECGFISKKTIKQFINRNLQSEKLDKLIKLMGLQLFYELYRRFFKRS